MYARGLFLSAAFLVAPLAAAIEPADLLDPTPRNVLVRVENSSNLATVGTTYGPPATATYSAIGTTGTLVIPISSHEELRSGFLDPVPSTFTDITITIDLTTFEATSSVASGDLASGPTSQTFSEGPLDTTALAGFVGPDTAPFACTSQAEVDTACLSVPLFCGQTCVIVPGAPFNPLTGKINLVGNSVESGCDGAFCQGPFTLFSGNGDLLITEFPESSTVAPSLHPVLVALLATAAALTMGRVRSHRLRN